MSGPLSWIDTLFFGVRRIFAAGSELPERPALNFVGATVTDNPGENRTDVVLGPPAWIVTAVVTGSYAAKVGELVRVDATVPVTVTLPAASSSIGREILVKEVAGGTSDIAIEAQVGEFIDGADKLTISGAYAKVGLVSDGERWLSI
jgi:hypothetical protein